MIPSALVCFSIFVCTLYHKEESKQAKLDTYLEKCDAALERGGLSYIKVADRSRALGNEVNDNRVGSALWCRLPGLPTIVTTIIKDKKNRGYADLYVYSKYFSFYSLQESQSHLHISVLRIGSIKLTSWRNNRSADSIRLTFDHRFYTFIDGSWIHDDDRNYGFFKQMHDALESPGGLALLLSLPSTEAKSRFRLEITKEDSRYAYVKISPVTESDRDLFRTGQVVIDKDNFLPRRLWYAFPDGDSRTVIINDRDSP
jgi:hypothetical protein